jgi:hypothetical protein
MKLETIKKQIDTMIKKINDVAKAFSEAQEQCRQELLTILTPVFENDTELQASVDELMESNEYGINEYSEIYSWCRVDIDRYKELGDYIIEALQEWLNESHCIYIDTENDAFTYNQGDDNITINDDGDIFEGNKLIIDSNEYKDVDDDDAREALRNELIENHMAKTGYFPGVFSVDRHGNVFSVSTIKNK